jgi:hypothetical protein
MPRPKKPATNTIRKIYDVLSTSPLCFEAICDSTGLHRNTCGSALKFLIEKGMVCKEREKHKVVYEVTRGKGPFLRLETRWDDLMMTKEDYQQMYKDFDVENRKWQREKRAEDLKWKMINSLVDNPRNEQLVNLLKETNNYDIPLLRLKQNLEMPFCLSCLRHKKKFFQMIYDKETGEFVCPNCGEIKGEYLL